MAAPESEEQEEESDEDSDDGAEESDVSLLVSRVYLRGEWVSEEEG